MAWENLAIDLYVNQQLSIRSTTLRLRGEGCVVSRIRLTSFLRENGFIRTSADARRGKSRALPNVPERCCEIPGCSELFAPNSGSQKFCRICIPNAQARAVWQSWKIAWPQFMIIYEYQGGLCGGCGCELARGPKGPTSLCIDHDHVTGEIRGLLCHRCNTALGHVNDDPVVLRKLATYVENGGSHVCV